MMRHGQPPQPPLSLIAMAIMLKIVELERVDNRERWLWRCLLCGKYAEGGKGAAKSHVQRNHDGVSFQCLPHDNRAPMSFTQHVQAYLQRRAPNRDRLQQQQVSRACVGH